jgi:hypothetical protein
MSPVVLMLVVLSQVDGGAAVRVGAAQVGQAGQLGSQGASLDAEARYLAGLPDAGLTTLENTPAFARHVKDLDANWSKLEKRRLAPMRTWATSELWPRIDGKKPLLYFFGGPDAISADVLYPDAPVLVLCGLERPGNLAPLEALKPAELENALVSLRTTIRTTVDVSYFITDQMGGDMLKSPLKGVLPVLMLFLSRNGETVLEATPVTIDEQGKLVELDKHAPKDPSGWRLRFKKGAGPVRELFYWRLDLSDEVAKKTPGFFAWLTALGPTNSFLKAASFILHDKRFSVTLEHLLAHSASILEDDSGAPFKFLATPEWDLTLFGAYSPPRATFEHHVQADMAAAWKKGPALPLPFATGYKHSGPNSHLLLAVKRPAAGDAGTP